MNYIKALVYRQLMYLEFIDTPPVEERKWTFFMHALWIFMPLLMMTPIILMPTNASVTVKLLCVLCSILIIASVNVISLQLTPIMQFIYRKKMKEEKAIEQMSQL